MAIKHKGMSWRAKGLIGGGIFAGAVGLWLGGSFGFGIGIGGAKGAGFGQDARNALQEVKKIGEAQGARLRQEAQKIAKEAKKIKDKVIGKVSDEPLDITIIGDVYLVDEKPLSLEKAIRLAADHPHGVRIILKPSAKSGARGDLRSALRQAGVHKVREIKE